MAPRAVATVCLVLSALIWLAAWCAASAPQTDGLLPTLTPTRAITVQPTATGVLEAELRPTKTPKPPIVLNDRLPMATATPRPSATPTASPTPVPTRTPRPELPPVQKGESDAVARPA